MKNAFLVILFFSVLAGRLAAAELDLEKVGADMKTTLTKEHDAGRFDGVALVGRSDGQSYKISIGFSDRETKTRHQTGAAWRWASVSKQVAAVLTLQLVEQGQLSLDTPVGQLLPEFGAPNAQQLTVMDLLRHTTGLPNPDDSPIGRVPADSMPSFYRANVKTSGSAVGQALKYCAGPPKSAPGGRFDYNNCDTLVLQAILERVTKMSYGQLLKRSLTQPLQLTSVGLVERDGDGLGRRESV